jgi:hypothetical protein
MPWLITSTAHCSLLVVIIWLAGTLPLLPEESAPNVAQFDEVKPDIVSSSLNQLTPLCRNRAV